MQVEFDQSKLDEELKEIYMNEYGNIQNFKTLYNLKLFVSCEYFF